MLGVIMLHKKTFMGSTASVISSSYQLDIILAQRESPSDASDVLNIENAKVQIVQLRNLCNTLENVYASSDLIGFIIEQRQKPLDASDGRFFFYKDC